MATRREDILPTPVGVPSPAAPTVRATSAPAAPGAAPTSPAEPETPRAPSASTPPSGVPQFSDSPLAAIGVVLQDFAAGMRGQPLRSQQIAQAQMARRQLQVQEIDAGFKLLGHVRKEVQTTKAGTPEREAKMEEMDKLVGAILPTFQPMLESLEGIPGAGDVLETIPEFAEVFQAACGDDVECILEKASDDDFIKPFQRRRDDENTPKIGDKLMRINQGLASSPGAEALLPRDQFGNISMNFSTLEAMNENLPEEMRFTDSELGTMRRRPSILAAHGIMTPDALQEFQETQAREAAKEPFRERARRQQAGISLERQRLANEGQERLETMRQRHKKELAQVEQQTELSAEQAAEVGNTVKQLDLIADTIKKVQDVGNLGVGFGSDVAQVAGIFGQVFGGDDFDRFLTSMVSGGDDTSQELRMLENQLLELTVQALPDFKALFDRVSEAEREILQEIEGLSTKLTTAGNVEKTLHALYASQLMKMNRERIINEQPQIFDTTLPRDQQIAKVREWAEASNLPVNVMVEIANRVKQSGVDAIRIKQEQESARRRQGPLLR